MALIEAEGRRALWIGSAAALVIYLLPLPRFVLSYLAILIHELGHAATAWGFGYPAIPSFDFFYGGGVSFQFSRNWLLLLLAYGVLAALFVRARGRPRFQALVAVSAAIYTLSALTPLHEIAILAMGHGAELAVATLFFYRALSGRGIEQNLERPLYAMCGSFLTLSAIVFAYRLASSALFRRDYEQAKGGGHWMDMSRLAEDYLKVNLTLIALVYFVAALLPLLLAYLYVINRDEIRTRLGALF